MQLHNPLSSLALSGTSLELFQSFSIGSVTTKFIPSTGVTLPLIKLWKFCIEHFDYVCNYSSCDTKEDEEDVIEKKKKNNNCKSTEKSDKTAEMTGRRKESARHAKDNNQEKKHAGEKERA